jgi:hypothetical protein
MGFQRIAERDFGAIRDLFSRWVESASPMGQRAILAALAHPPILDIAENARYCLQIADRILAEVASADRASRKSEGFRVLKQGLEYALSVFVEPLPEEGFPFLKRWAQRGDPDVAAIVRSNLQKARLAKKYPARVAEALALV